MAIDIAESMRGFGGLSLQSAVFEIYAEQVESLARQFDVFRNTIAPLDACPATAQVGAGIVAGSTGV